MKVIWEDMDVFEATDDGTKFFGICLGRPEIDRYFMIRPNPKDIESHGRMVNHLPPSNAKLVTLIEENNEVNLAINVAKALLTL